MYKLGRLFVRTILAGRQICTYKIDNCQKFHKAYKLGRLLNLYVQFWQAISEQTSRFFFPDVYTPPPAQWTQKFSTPPPRSLDPMDVYHYHA